uniref:Uncharacterized protein OJ1080_F08.120 n=2 Tax=Oryza sativa subsp. japonica TaxID=39947 RepID=Q8GSC1_ORYSJ|nr:hypothetical protein [Oryza sativa Japonica Group]BAC20094.1 hypothetical protein [Oryza sativa Japonica Group]
MPLKNFKIGAMPLPSFFPSPISRRLVSPSDVASSHAISLFLPANSAATASAHGLRRSERKTATPVGEWRRERRRSQRCGTARRHRHPPGASAASASAGRPFVPLLRRGGRRRRPLSHPDFCFRIYKLFNKLLLEFILNVR